MLYSGVARGRRWGGVGGGAPGPAGVQTAPPPPRRLLLLMLLLQDAGRRDGGHLVAAHHGRSAAQGRLPVLGPRRRSAGQRAAPGRALQGEVSGFFLLQKFPLKKYFMIFPKWQI